MRRRDEDDVVEEERGGGAGGKMTQRAFRRMAPPNPYDRPSVALGKEPGKGDGLVSKILARPASTVLPSLFPSSSSKQDYPPPSESIPESRKEDFDRVSSPDTQTLQANDPGVFAEKSQSHADPEVHRLLGDKAKKLCDSGGVAEIEQWLKQKTFSREQSDCLMELLRLRTRDLFPDFSDDEHAAGFVKEAQGTLNLKSLRESAKCATLSEQWTTPKHQEPFQMRVAHDVGSSPVEIAKAYMEAVANEYHESYSGRSAHEKGSFENDASASEMSYPSVLKSPMYRPGAFVESNHSYLTQTRRFKVEPDNFQRTPYNGSIFSRSKFQGGGGSQKTQNVPLSRWKRSSTSFGGVMIPDKYNGLTPSKELDTSNLASFCSLSPATSNAMKKLSSNLTVISEKDSLATSWNSHTAKGSEFSIGPSSVHPKSSQMAQKILEHLDRVVPSSKEEMAHPKLEKSETEAFPKSANSAMDWHDKRPDEGIIVDDKPKYSLGKDVTDKDNLAAEKATSTAKPVMSKYHADILPSIAPKSSNQSIFRATHKSSDEGVAFTFPVRTSLNSSFEPPPTPTMTLSPSVCRTINNAEDNLSFSFGSPRADSGLVFSNGYTSNSTLIDTTALQFKFGSEKQRSLSFRSTSKDSICF